MGEEDATIMSGQRRRHTPKQVIRKLREGERLLGPGKQLLEVCKHLEVSDQNLAPVARPVGGMKADDAKRLKELGGRTSG